MNAARKKFWKDLQEKTLVAELKQINKRPPTTRDLFDSIADVSDTFAECQPDAKLLMFRAIRIAKLVRYPEVSVQMRGLHRIVQRGLDRIEREVLKSKKG